ncbi:cyclic nucleotide-binding domain-containing protein [Lacrimispora sp.]|uniref:cyclic nucleotide-binding domain-containing protein n=1 Tax=Lacrimispora sp. TaxID=2719234 RepID=UPI0029E56952|nr:family transcriptional regulator, putative post-exponential-phase nitrogen-starvation [Lacrimispora sp.]
MKQFVTCEIPEVLLRMGQERRFLKGSNIFKAGESITHCYYIRSEVVKIYIDHENGRRSILDFAGRQDWLGELSVFCNEDFTKENRVVDEISCLEFDISKIRQMCKKDGSISFYFASYISSKLMARSFRLSEYLNYSLEKRFASFILSHHKGGVYGISHTDVSEYMNVSYRHILFVMKKFCDEGIMKKEKGYIIADFGKLREIAERSE